VVTAADPVSAMSTTDVANGLAASLTPTVATATYFLRVDGVGNGTANSGYTDYASLGAYRLTLSGSCDATPLVTAPGAPQGLSASVRAADVEVDVDWAPPASDGGDPVVGYVVSVNHEVVADLGADQTAVTLDDLDGGETYTLQVRALNGLGLGDAAQTSFSVPSGNPAMTAPSAPRIGAAKSGVRGGKSTAKAVWSPPSTDGGIRVTGYQVLAQRLNRSGAVIGRVTSRWLGGSARSVTLKLAKGRYRFVVVARNLVGVSPASAGSKVVRAR
jgi:Fibronectin type III domain